MLPSDSSDTFKVQLTNGLPTSGSGKLRFDRSGGVRPMLVGYQMDLGVFILWDADLHDFGGRLSVLKERPSSPRHRLGCSCGRDQDGESPPQEDER